VKSCARRKWTIASARGPTVYEDIRTSLAKDLQKYDDQGLTEWKFPPVANPIVLGRSRHTNVNPCP
jgi:hypothetical protein